MSRDRAPGEIDDPDSYQPYAFARSAATAFADPSGCTADTGSLAGLSAGIGFNLNLSSAALPAHGLVAANVAVGAALAGLAINAALSHTTGPGPGGEVAPNFDGANQAINAIGSALTAVYISSILDRLSFRNSGGSGDNDYCVPVLDTRLFPCSAAIPGVGALGFYFTLWVCGSTRSGMRNFTSALLTAEFSARSPFDRRNVGRRREIIRAHDPLWINVLVPSWVRR